MAPRFALSAHLAARTPWRRHGPPTRERHDPPPGRMARHRCARSLPLHYSFSVHCGGERSADGRMVVVNVANEAGEPRPWNDRERQLLLESGPLRPELLTVP